MRPTVYLFDIDGTLLHGHGAGRRAMDGAFAEITGDDTSLRTIGFAGMTDPAIVRAGLRVAGRAPEHDAETIPAVIESYLRRLADEIRTTPEFRLHVGVREILEALALRGQAAIGLGTGNVERGARIKLQPLGIADAFAFGGYASDHEDRPTLIGIGADRGRSRLGGATDVRVVVIGDTPKDIAAAQAIGAECLAVATSVYDAAALHDAGATRVVADLTDPAALAYLL